MSKQLIALCEKSSVKDNGNHAHHSNRIKSLYLSHLIKEKKIDQNTLIINEFSNLHSGVRADIALVTRNNTEAIEIKSSLDSLRRLENQVKSYLECFNKVTIVTERKHLHNVIFITNETNAGIVLLDGSFFVTVKRARRSKIDKSVIIKKLTPNIFESRRATHADYINYIREKYSSNMEYVTHMIDKGHATEADVAQLNPSWVRRERFNELEKSIEESWEKLAEGLQINPIFLSKLGN